MNNLGIPKWIDLLVSIYNEPLEKCYTEKLQRRMKITSSHARKVLKLLESAGLVYRIKTRKIQYIALTQKGKQTAELLMRAKQEAGIYEFNNAG